VSKSVFTEDYRALIQTVVEARKSAKLTQAELAGRLGKPQSYVSKVESGERRLDVVELTALAEALGTDPAGLLAAFLRARRQGPNGS
jgi:transcriptional regulator with XRE-family HTH domain